MPAKTFSTPLPSGRKMSKNANKSSSFFHTKDSSDDAPSCRPAARRASIPTLFQKAIRSSSSTAHPLLGQAASPKLRPVNQPAPEHDHNADKCVRIPPHRHWRVLDVRRICRSRSPRRRERPDRQEEPAESRDRDREQDQSLNAITDQQQHAAERGREDAADQYQERGSLHRALQRE